MPASHLSPVVLCLIGSIFLCLLIVLSRLRPTQNAIDVPIGNKSITRLPDQGQRTQCAAPCSGKVLGLLIPGPF